MVSEKTTPATTVEGKVTVAERPVESVDTATTGALVESEDDQTGNAAGLGTEVEGIGVVAKVAVCPAARGTMVLSLISVNPVIGCGFR